MKAFLIILILILIASILYIAFLQPSEEFEKKISAAPGSSSSGMTPVMPGIDVLKEQNYQLLAGKRIALVTNHTGCDRDGNSDIDLLFAAPNVHLIKLFSPEHGIRGESEGTVTNSIDPKTKLPIISLYGQYRIPSPEVLADIEILVFDIQDIGVRYYTYIATMAQIMQAAKKYNQEVIILDRPNPIGGIKVEGTIPPENLTHQFTAIFPIATRHGMTVGELAQMFNHEFAIHCPLKVIPMKGWRRSMYYDETGLSWLNPSPNMKTLTGAILYAGFGWLEGTNLSMGRGTEIPFEILGAPWLDSQELVCRMNSLGLKGMHFISWSFVPQQINFNYYRQQCHGLRIIIDDRDALDGLLAGLCLAQTIWQLHPQKFKFQSHFPNLIGTADVESWLKAGLPPAEIKQKISGNLDEFRLLRQKYLLYP